MLSVRLKLSFTYKKEHLYIMLKLTPSQAGKLGGIKSSETSLKKYQERVDKYLLNPATCKNCSNPLEYKKRRNIFCSSSCSALFNNPLKGQFIACLFCKQTIRKKRHNTKFCNKSCSTNYHHQINNEKKIIKFFANQVSNYPIQWIRKTLREHTDYKCSICNINEWCGKPITLEIDHIDGNYNNNIFSNLRLLCRNCHGQTPTYGSKNRGNGRYLRRMRYANGLSS